MRSIHVVDDEYDDNDDVHGTNLLDLQKGRGMERPSVIVVQISSLTYLTMWYLNDNCGKVWSCPYVRDEVCFL